MKKLSLLLLLLSTITYAQKSVNAYKYVIIPNKFDFVKHADQYQTSSLTKFLFKKYGFDAYIDNEQLPDDLAKNRCLALTGDVKDESGMFTAKSVIELRDCHNAVVYTSQVGKSKLKEYQKAYHESIREAFKSIQQLKYKYQPKDITEKSNDVELLVEEKKDVKNENIKSNTILYAQAISNGFQLVNTKPEKVYEILKTGIKDVFILKNKKGIVYKRNTEWVVEYYQGEQKEVHIYDIKF